LIRDLRHGIRSFARTPLFAVAAILTIALGIGANTAIFSFVSALLLRPLPFPEPERLVRIDSVRGNEIGKLTPREWEELDRDTDLFEGVAAWYPSQYNVTGGGTPEVLTACMTTANLFRVLGVNLVHGSSWDEGTHRDRNPVVVLNHEVWRRRFGGDPSIVGRTLPLDFSSYEVTGIAAPGFDFPGSMDIFRAAYLGSAQNWDVRSLFVVARLRPAAQAAAVAAHGHRCADKICSVVSPAASSSRTSSTVIRVPATVGFPIIIFGSETIEAGGIGSGPMSVYNGKPAVAVSGRYPPLLHRDLRLAIRSGARVGI
jgi:putative ABC transport system permease protein